MIGRRSFLGGSFLLPAIDKISRSLSSAVTFGLGTLSTASFGAVKSGPSLPSLTLAAAKPGTHDYTFGQVFKKGAVPAGTKLKATAAESQVDWLQTWSDGSLLQAAVTVREPMTTVAKEIGFVVGSAPGSALTLANLIAANPQASVRFDDIQDFSYDPASTFTYRAKLGTTSALEKHRATCNRPDVVLGEVQFDEATNELWVTVSGGTLGVPTRIELKANRVGSTTSYSVNHWIYSRTGGGIAWDPVAKEMVPANVTKVHSGVLTVSLSDVINLTNNGTKAGGGGLMKQRISGPQMSEWKFYAPVVPQVPTRCHLAVYFTVRLYKSGRYWVRTTVENGWVNVDAPTSAVYTGRVTIAGEQKWTGPITQPHHTRWSLAFWSGTEPDIVPCHDKQYIKDTRLVPNYVGKLDYRGSGKPSIDFGAGRLAPYSLVLSCAPMERANHPASGMGSGGFAPWIGLLPAWDVMYILDDQADDRTWHGLIANSDAANRYAYHYRDEATMLPVRPTDHPASGIPDALSGGFARYTNNDKLPTPTGAATDGYAATHAPAPPYLAALMTADDHYAEECSFIMCIIFGGSVGSRQPGLLPSHPYGRGIQSMIHFDSAVRGFAWTIRSFFLAARVSSDAAIRDELIELLARNLYRTRVRSVDGTAYNGEFKDNLGLVYWGGGMRVWMHQFCTAALGYGWDLDLPFSQSQRDDFRAVRDHAYKLPIGVLGDASGFCWRRGGVYDAPLADSTTWDKNPGFQPDFATLWTKFSKRYALPPLDSCGYGETQISAATPKPTELRGIAYGTNYSLTSVIAAIAYAVDHGATGAKAGYARFFGSSTFNKPGGGRAQWDAGVSMWSIISRSVQ